jgi:hypothetical protein
MVLPRAIAPFSLLVPHHAEQLPHVAIQKFIVISNHAFQIIHGCLIASMV